MNGFAEDAVGYGAHACRNNVGMLDDGLLDLCWCNVDATTDDEVFLAIDDPNMFVAIDHSNVARSQPSAVECLGVGFGVVEISRRDETARELELTTCLAVE